LSGVHLNDQVFAAAVSIADIADPKSSELVAAASGAFLHAGVTSAAKWWN
jgi:hypothetical protein